MNKKNKKEKGANIIVVEGVMDGANLIVVR